MERKADFNDRFYEKAMPLFVQFLSEKQELPLGHEESKALHPAKVFEFNRSIEYSKNLIIEIIAKCAREHGFRFRYFAVRSEVMETIAGLAHLNSKLLNIGIVKFFKSVIRTKVRNRV